MRFSRPAKLFLLVVASFCFLSLWTSLNEQKIDMPSLPLETSQIHGVDRKSLAYQGSGNNLATKDIDNGAIQTKDKATVGAGAHRPGKQIRTILMSYMRSGSTFTGDLFQASPDVTYLYEPLLYTNDVDELNKNTPIRSRIIYKFFQDRHLPETLDYTLATLGCNLTGSNLRYLIGYSYSRSFADYGKCVQGLTNKADFSPCSPDITKRCQTSRNVISKILRLKMWEVKELLTRDPELQIIHLVRDPRGIAMSRSVARYYLNIKTLCARMNRDASESIQLQKQFPGRILTARYEDLALSPMNMTRKLFHHAGVNWTPEVAEKVQDLTSPSNNSFDEKIFGTKRKNSSATAFNWRTKLAYSTAMEIQKSCKEMMEFYGYNSFSTHNQMLNLGFSSVKDKYTDEFYKAQNIHVVGL